MEEACAEGVGEEHYRLEGKRPLPHPASSSVTGVSLFHRGLDEAANGSPSEITTFNFSTAVWLKLSSVCQRCTLLPFTPLHFLPSVSPRCCSPHFHPSTISLPAKCTAESRQQVEHIFFPPFCQTPQVVFNEQITNRNHILMISFCFPAVVLLLRHMEEPNK